MVNKKNNKVILTCSVCLSRNYSTTRNKVNQNERLELMKFCKKCNEHTLHKETK
ncbi:50S ribosomal protein L33 1 [bioreactor metagenome]|uniref:50S ribosomal protein L33 1 n=1 Tax=bioreactor metagenome TaxID=1076179 RepID=A0A644ZQ70_9ZZZZ|nr:50S ribosomal protein L33 [Erysipelotrichaceae bacterium]